MSIILFLEGLRFLVFLAFALAISATFLVCVILDELTAWLREHKRVGGAMLRIYRD